MMHSVLGIDPALDWAAIGSAKLTFAPGGDAFQSVAKGQEFVLGIEGTDRLTAWLSGMFESDAGTG